MKKHVRNLLLGACLAPLFGAVPVAAQGSGYDIVIKGGRVIDPASGRDEIADVGISGGTIAAISTSPLSGKRVLDAKGQVVAPGFIDYHAHGQDPRSQSFQLLDGVTTAMEMESGVMPIAQFYAGKQGKALINFGATANFICARMEVLTDLRCGQSTSDETTMSRDALLKSANEEEEGRIIAAVEREIDAGALGIGIGLEYAPGTGRREIYKAFKAAAKHKVPVFVHVRMREESRATGMPIAVANELIADAAATGAGLQLVHVTSTALGDTPTVIEIMKGAAAHGVDVTTEAYPYEAGSTALGSEFFSEGWQQRSGITYKDLQWTATGERLTEETFNKYRKENPTGTVVVFMIPQAAIDAAMADPFVSIASDGMVMSDPKVHPRGAGSYSRVLGHYVRDRKLLDLKTALTKMTILPARRLEKVAPAMARKGRIQVGADADITVFDPATVKDNATYENPLQASSGYRYVLVGGNVMVQNGKITPNLFPGVGIKRGAK
ncbi:amidohydrolase family protein [Sphingosinicella rhizophila]|uniref:Amidohydrolase family protein n=1 Tax=Sphingosinicella rhizophila TaxID=3050082 RepID=A0ABU3Q221_9SPHN|nr:amidohydrolase family protein [Sphingosinicella sp. GR2756]MDT9597457.1 amidohydrolase family protein [Sphingosinicella sp. GR2756]